MVQLATKRTAIVLYSVLLVLPTVVLGALQWHQLRLDHDADLAAIPGDVQDAARRLRDDIKVRVSTLLDSENQRPFYEYGKQCYPPGAVGGPVVLVTSPLVENLPPKGITAWFVDKRRMGGAPELLAGPNDRLESWPVKREALVAASAELQRLEEKNSGNDFRRYIANMFLMHGSVREENQELKVLAVNLSTERDLSCLVDALPGLPELASKVLPLQVTSFRVRFFVDAEHHPHAIATRLVRLARNEELVRTTMPTCFSVLQDGIWELQGFFLDTRWLLEELPQTRANAVLDANQVLLGSGETPAAGSEVAQFNLIDELGFELPHHEDSQTFVYRVAIDRRGLDKRLRSRELAFLSVAGMLVLSLGTGLVLLFRSVQRDLENARRTENFVSAVTHELRTPLSAVKLYGEMLAEGWVTDEAKRAEYYRRILRESTRLETLVERVLHKGQLTRNELVPEPGDLVRAIEPLVPLLSEDGSPHAPRDLVFELPAGLPLVMLHVECVRSIVTNLVENARKYAPVDTQDPQAEPILVRVQLVERRLRLEVLDRGPGIPAAERSRIFQAFYRIGNEATRASKGTGLGLHLVALQAEAMGATVEALEREGGGTIFRVSFAPAEEPRA